MKKTKIGIFGGSFSPPHAGHRRAAEAFRSHLELDKLLVVPAFLPPHKTLCAEASVKDRLAMCNIAFGDIDNCEISDVEIERGGRSYTYLTLQELARDDAELYMLIGTDMMLTLDRWKNPDIIFSLATVCYVRRESDGTVGEALSAKAEEYRRRFGARIVEIPSDALEISSTELREMITSGKSVSSLLDARVYNYIKERGLYS